MKPLALTSAFVLLIFSAAVSAQESVSSGLPGGGGPEDLQALIEQVADDMEREFIIDPRLSGQQGYSTNEDLDYESLLGVLRINGFVAVETAGQILVVPEQDARSLPTRILQEDDSRVSDHELVTRMIVIPELIEVIENEEGELVERSKLQATMLVPVLRPMMPQNAQLGAIPNTNSLIMIDRYDNIRRITAVIEEIIEGLDD